MTTGQTADEAHVIWSKTPEQDLVVSVTLAIPKFKLTQLKRPTNKLHVKHY